MKHALCIQKVDKQNFIWVAILNIIDTLFNTLLQNFQLIQETSNENGRKFFPDSIELLEYELNKINIIRVESYIVSPDWIASKKETINPKNEKDKCFQCSIIVGLHYNIKEKDTGKIFNKKIIQQLLIFYLYHITVKK